MELVLKHTLANHKLQVLCNVAKNFLILNTYSLGLFNNQIGTETLTK